MKNSSPTKTPQGPKPVVVAIGEPELRQRILDSLTSAGLKAEVDASGASAPVAIIQDDNKDLHSLAPIIRIWDLVRQKRTSPAVENPFEGDHIISWIGAEPDLDTTAVTKVITHLTNRTYISLSDFLAPDAKIVSVRETDSISKVIHRQRLHAFFESSDISSAVLDALELALEELFTNAVYNAPVDSMGRSISAGMSRMAPVQSPKPFAVRFGRDNELAAVSVLDEYGTLDPKRIMEVLKRCYAPGGAVYEDKSGGAGLGFFMLLQNATRMVVNIKAGQFTEVIFLRRINQRRRDFMRSTPTLTFCVIDGSEAQQTSRHFERRKIAWQGIVTFQGTPHKANILDICEAGAFVSPADPLPLTLSPGDELSVTIFPPERPEGVDIAAKVRWLGHSNEHGCQGFGVQFEKQVSLGPELQVEVA